LSLKSGVHADVLKVRGEKGMPNFDASKMANNNRRALRVSEGTFRYVPMVRFSPAVRGVEIDCH